jgi:hypothetical protein
LKNNKLKIEIIDKKLKIYFKINRIHKNLYKLMMINMIKLEMKIIKELDKLIKESRFFKYIDYIFQYFIIFYSLRF